MQLILGRDPHIENHCSRHFFQSSQMLAMYQAFLNRLVAGGRSASRWPFFFWSGCKVEAFLKFGCVWGRLDLCSTPHCGSDFFTC